MASGLSCINLSASNRLLRKGKRQGKGKVSLVKVLAAQALLVLRHCHDCRVSERGFRCPRTFQQPGMLDHFWTHKLVVSLYLCKPLCFFLCLSVAVCKTTFFSPIRKKNSFSLDTLAKSVNSLCLRQYPECKGRRAYHMSACLPPSAQFVKKILHFSWTYCTDVGYFGQMSRSEMAGERLQHR